jgi:integrase
MLRKYLKRAGIGKSRIHTSRHIGKSTSAKTIQDVMGLKDVRSTSVYQTLARDVVSRELQEHAI